MRKKGLEKKGYHRNRLDFLAITGVTLPEKFTTDHFYQETKVKDS